jgi:phosphonate transport system substrate-binding protein
MYFVPSMEAGKIITSGKAIADYLHNQTGYYFKVAVPTSYAAVIEAMGTNEADIAWLATFAYILAHQKYGAQVELTTVRNGLAKYRGQFVAQANSGIKELKDIEGKIIAYTDASSTSGYIYPSALLKKNNIKPKSYIFTGGHPQSILAVYEGKADVGCSFWSPPDKDGNPKDARTAVLDTHPDVLKKVIPFAYTDWIPNDTVTFRKDFPQEMKDKVVNALLQLPKQKEGKKMLHDLLDIDDFVKAKDSDYDIVRETLKTMNKNAEEFIK